MSTMKKCQNLLYCRFNKFIKRSGTSFHSPALTQKHIRNVSHTAHFKRNKHKCNFHYVAMCMMASQILNSMDSQKHKNLDISRTKHHFFLK